MSEQARVLLVAHQTAATAELLDAVRERAARGNASFHLVVPRRPHGIHKMIDPEEADANEARSVLDAALPKLRQAAAGAVTGEIGDPEPLMAIQDAVNLQHFDEIIISTLPLGISRWLRLDVVSKARGLGLPVTHVLATDPAESMAGIGS
jgi:hypothetical protein